MAEGDLIISTFLSRTNNKKPWTYVKSIMFISLQASLWDSMFSLSWNNHILNYFKNKGKRTPWSIVQVSVLQCFYPSYSIWWNTGLWWGMDLLQEIPQSKCDGSILSRLNKYHMLLMKLFKHYEYKNIHRYGTGKT